MKLILATLAAALVATSASAQLAPPNANGITYGHIHLNVRDIEVHKKFWPEYFGGEVFAMAGASYDHSTIVENTFASLRAQLQDGPCRVKLSDVRVQVGTSGLFAYPDLTVVCGPPQFQFGKRDVALLVEVNLVLVLGGRDVDLSALHGSLP